MEQNMRYMDTKPNMIIIDKENLNLVAATEGTGDNLLEEDEVIGQANYEKEQYK